jgi:hypothetical protein
MASASWQRRLAELRRLTRPAAVWPPSWARLAANACVNSGPPMALPGSSTMPGSTSPCILAPSRAAKVTGPVSDIGVEAVRPGEPACGGSLLRDVDFTTLPREPGG